MQMQWQLMLALSSSRLIATLGQDGSRWRVSPSVARSTLPGADITNLTQAFFNVMLKEMGVRGAKVQEVLSIEDDMLAILP